jgi:hypothetical protein
MILDVVKSADIVEMMENYILGIRPEPEIRNELDLNYEINGQSIILNEVRPAWDNPDEILTCAYAKTTYDKNKNIWKVFWQRADNKWHPYKPKPTVRELSDFLKLVDEDEFGCFKG